MYLHINLLIVSVSAYYAPPTNLKLRVGLLTSPDRRIRQFWWRCLLNLRNVESATVFHDPTTNQFKLWQWTISVPWLEATGKDCPSCEKIINYDYWCGSLHALWNLQYDIPFVWCPGIHARLSRKFDISVNVAWTVVDT